MTTSSKTRACAAAISVALFVVPASSLAQPQPQQTQPPQPSAADLESARELFKEARELRQNGDLPRALERFKAAHAYGQTPVTGLELGRTHMQLGELVEAREVLLSVARMKVQADETDKSSGARAEAVELADEIKKRIPTITVKVTGPASDAGVTLSVDGAAVPVVSLGGIRKTNPGKHVVVARLGARQESRDVEVAEGETRHVDIELPPGAAPAGPPDAVVPSAGRTISPVTWIGLGVGALGLGVGAVTGVIALGKASNVDDACDSTRCPPSARDDVDSGRSVATVSTIGFGIGIAGLATAAIGYFVLSKPRTAAARVTPFVTAGGLGFDGRF